MLRLARAELQDEFGYDRREATTADDIQLSIGRGGFALVADSEPVEMVTWFRELRGS